MNTRILATLKVTAQILATICLVIGCILCPVTFLLGGNALDAIWGTGSDDEI